jgi:hypothetical protein
MDILIAEDPPKNQAALWAKSSRSEITGENPELAFSKRKFSKSKKEMRFFIERALGSYFRSLHSA